MSLTISLPSDVARQIADEEAREAELVAQIHRLSAPKSLSERRRYQRLRRKNQADEIMEAERDELFALIDADELRAVELLKYLGELAKLRGVHLLDVIRELGLEPKA